MARMYSRRRGKAGSHKPVGAEKPKWVDFKPDEIERLIVKLRKGDLSAALIGNILKDQYGIPSVKLATGKTMTQILAKNKLVGEHPEDMMHLMKKVGILKKHLEENKKDYHSKRGLIITESKIRKLGKYYSRKKVLPANWKYDPEKAKLLVQ